MVSQTIVFFTLFALVNAGKYIDITVKFLTFGKAKSPFLDTWNFHKFIVKTLYKTALEG